MALVIILPKQSELLCDVLTDVLPIENPPDASPV